MRGSCGSDSVRIPGLVDGRPTSFIVDSGANRTIVSRDVLSRPHMHTIPNGLADVTGRHTDLYGPEEVCLSINGRDYCHTVFICEELTDPVILGLDFLQNHRCVLNFERGVLCLDGDPIPLIAGPGDEARECSSRAMRVRVLEPVTIEPGVQRLVRCKPVGPSPHSPVLVDTGPVPRSGLIVGRTIINPDDRFVGVVVANLSEQPWRIRAGRAIGRCERVDLPDHSDVQDATQFSYDTPSSRRHPHLQELLDRSCVGLSDEQGTCVSGLIESFADVFSSGDHDLGRTSLAEHTINTGNSRPVKVPPRRIPIHKRQEAEETIEKLKQQGLIEPSQSPWSSALVFVRKKDGTLRCCVDYRLLNAATIKDTYPLPRIDATLDALSGSTWFSTLDLKSGYHQIILSESDRPKTAFSCGNGGLWHWRVMPFGLSNAPATFERLMETVLSGLHWQSALVYLDDIVVFGRSFTEKLDRLREVLRRLRQANLKLNPKKCALFRTEVPFLGHIVSAEGVKTDPEKTKAVREWPVPQNVKELRSFLGFCSYYRRFVKDFATIAAPLHAMLKDVQRFEWSVQCQEAFVNLKAALVSAPILQYPDPQQPFILDTDASAHGIGAVLSQLFGGEERVVAYYSRALSAPERNYCTTRKELLAVVEAARQFHPYLYGAEFTVRSDHSALQWLRKLKDPEGQLARWLARLDQYRYKVVHRSGEKHVNADALSRRPCRTDCRYCTRRETDTENKCRVSSVQPTVGSLMDIGKQQREDSDIAPLIASLERRPEKPDWKDVSSWSLVSKRYWAQWELLKFSDGVLWRKWESTDGSSACWLHVVPKTLRDSVLSEAHGSVSSCHFGIKKTIHRLRSRFYWIGMRRDVCEWCRICETCVAKKGPPRTPQAPLQIVSVGAPMERVAVDIAGPFPVSASGNRYILVVIDYFTKWPEVFPLPNQEANTVARALVDGFFSRFGVPRELHSDQGRNFESTVFRECCEILGIRKTRTTPMHPESDGMVERFNRTLVQEVAKRCRHGQTDWDQSIPTILMAYRSAVHESTGYTPAQLMLGHDPNLPLDMLIERPPDARDDKVTTTEFAKSLRERMSEIRSTVASNLAVSAETMKQRKDAKATMRPLNEGDQVWLYNPRRKKGQSPKLASPWEGPYLILKALSAVTYRIRAPGKTTCKVVHFNRLWRMKGPPKFTWTDALHRDEGAHESEGSHRDIGDTAPVAGRMASGITPALGVDRLMDASARDSTISDVDSTSDAAAAPVGHRTEAGGSGGLRRSGRRRAPPNYLHYA